MTDYKKNYKIKVLMRKLPDVSDLIMSTEAHQMKAWAFNVLEYGWQKTEGNKSTYISPTEILAIEVEEVE